MDLLETIFLGIVQGATEFLPVSSSGHLILFQNLSNTISDEDLFLNIMLHLGTLTAVVIYCWQEVKMLFRATTHIFRKPRTELEKQEKTLFLAIIAATIPTAVIGLTIQKTMTGFFSSWIFLGSTFLITSVVLLLSVWIKPRDRKLSPLMGFLVGIAQGFAVLPGISRAGATIVAGQALGLERKKAARFAFILAIPAIAGASLLEFVKGYSEATFNPNFLIPLICGIIAAALVGYLSLVVLTKIIEKAKLSWFALYTFAVSTFCFVWGLSIK